jgi:hypothetical protein
MAELVEHTRRQKEFEEDVEDDDEDDHGDDGDGDGDGDLYFSDLSDYFDEDAHLLDDNMMGGRVQELSLDEVSYERDINKVNVASNVKLQRGRFNPADLAKLHDVPTRDPRDPTFVKRYHVCTVMWSVAILFVTTGYPRLCLQSRKP